MSLRTWRGALIGAFLAISCGGEREAAFEDPSSQGDLELGLGLHGNGGQGPLPNWSTPTFANNAQVAEDGNQFFVAWSDWSRAGKLVAARVSVNGRLLDPDAIELNPNLRPDAYYHATAFDGRQFLVIWTGERSVFLTRVNRDGTLDGDPITLFTPTDHNAVGSPGIACHKRKCLVAWIASGHTVSREVRGVTLDMGKPGLDVQEVVISRSQSTEFSSGISVAWSEDQYLVAWTDTRYGSHDIFAARVRANGSVLDPNGFIISAAPGNQNYQSVTATKYGFFVAWSDSRSGSADIYGTRLKRGSANVQDPLGIRISTASTTELSPRVASEGDEVLVSWSALTADTARVRAARVKRNGDVRDRNGFAISKGPANRQLLFGNVAYASGRYFIVYGRAPVMDEPPYQVMVGTRVKNDDVVDNPAIRISHAPSVEQLAP